jgi:spermidine/putrescine transport system permease protein
VSAAAGNATKTGVAGRLPAVRRGRSRRDRASSLVESWLRGQTILLYMFLYIPIVIVVVFSFNATERQVTNWEGFSLKWYGRVLADRQIQNALFNSLVVASSTAIISTIVGTMAALGLQRAPRWFRGPFAGLTYVSIIVPEIVIALATLVFFSTSFDFLGPILGGRPKFGFPTIIAAHCLFNISLVCLLVQARLNGMDRTHVEASYDLYGTPWRTFWQITFPQLVPAIVAGFLLSFTFSFDDYVITNFVTGPGSTTLPIYIFGQVKRGVSPETNAVATMVLAFTVGMLLVGQAVLAWQGRRTGRRDGSMAAIVTER